MGKFDLNAVVQQRIEVAPGLMVIRVVPDGWQLPEFTPGQFAVLGLPPERVNIKATTTERLGFAGREEGIAAHWKYKEAGSLPAGIDKEDKSFAWLRQLMDWQRELKDPGEFLETVKNGDPIAIHEDGTVEVG